MIGQHNLRKAFKRTQRAKQDDPLEIPGVLGATIGGQDTVKHPTRSGYVYVCLRGQLSELVVAYNSAVPNTFGLHVIVTRNKKDKGKWIIQGRDTGVYQNWGASAYVPEHATQHMFQPQSIGNDIVWVYQNQFMPMAVVPTTTGSSRVDIPETTFFANGAWRLIGQTGTSAIAGVYNPTGSANARMVLVYCDANNNPALLAGTEFASGILTGTSNIASVIPHIPTAPLGTDIPLAGILLLTGTSTITWSNIYRTFLISYGTGTSTPSAGGHTITDDDTPFTQRTNLNFTGAGVTVSDDVGNDATDVTIPANMEKSVYDINNNGIVDNSESVPWTGISGTPSVFEPNTHADHHVSGGGDYIKLDDLATPDNNTDLNSTVSEHGLLPILSGNLGDAFRGNGTWVSTPTGTAVTTLLGLSDTPDSYSGKKGNYLRVNDPENAMIFTPTMYIRSVESNDVTIAITDQFVAVTGDYAPLVALPEVGAASGMVYTIKKMDSSLDYTGIFPSSEGVHIDGQDSISLIGQYSCVTLISDGNNWHIISRYTL
jgi:hypothetical protein